MGNDGLTIDSIKNNTTFNCSIVNNESCLGDKEIKQYEDSMERMVKVDDNC